jgi:hypothetical protein
MMPAGEFGWFVTVAYIVLAPVFRAFRGRLPKVAVKG